MKILMINVVCGIRSTGRICTDLAIELEKQGHEVKIAYGREHVPENYLKYAVKIGRAVDIKVHAIKSRLFDAAGFGSKKATIEFIEWVKFYNPDIIHLHNIHGYYINIEVLFKYLRTCGKKIIWTMHDCWPFTGHCAYFDYVECACWKTKCQNCKQKKEYPSCIGISRAKYNFEKKKQLFSGIPNMTIVTPSKWLADMIGESYLANYPIEVIYNGIDTSVFKNMKNSVKGKYKFDGKKIVLGVAAVWDRRKGLEYMVKLSEDDSLQIVIIGLSEKERKKLPSNIIGIERTADVEDLVQWYNLADVFVNPTLEDNYPTTNLEAIACGTPVITFDTGGSPESAKLYGVVVEKGNMGKLREAIRTEKIEIHKRDISINRMVEQYLELYYKVC